MTLDPIQQKQIMDLLILSLEGQAGREDMQKLREILDSSSEARDYYLRAIIAAECIRKTEWQAKDFVNETDSSEGLDPTLWRALAEEEKSAPAIEIAAPQEPETLLPQVRHPKVVHKISKSSWFSLASAAAVIFLVLCVRLVPPATEFHVAVVSDTLNAKWGDMDVKMEKDTSVYAGRENLVLREGFAKLRFDNQAQVTVEGPAEFQILAEDKINLRYGRLYAKVPAEAIGFMVTTQTAKVIDLGTEFGVEADAQGDTRLHVIKGKTTLVAGLKSDKISMEVIGGIAKKVSAGSQTVSDIACDGRLFVREINSAGNLVWRGETEINLADIVGGGNGFGTGKLDSGIETNTGRRFETPDPELVQSKVPGILSGGESYNKVSSLPLIDGVFVPDNRKGPVQITSAGHIFDGFIDGSEVFWGNIFNGAWHASDTSIKHNLKLNGQAYGTPDNPAISLHSNQGITFDLQAIRQTIPSGKILRFTSLFGVSQTVALDPLYSPKTGGPNFGKVNCWVLVDGKERFNRNSVTYLQGAAEIEVDISDEDRFLTLVVTESDDRRAYDWALFAMPSLLIEMNMN